MSAYVDTPRPGHVVGAPRARAWCHLIADTLEELHAVAAAAGMRREWFQAAPPASFPHYDLTASRRGLAVRAGAIGCDRATFVGHLRRIREAGTCAT